MRWVAPLLAWIVERERIYELKESGAPRPWTKDPILNRYRFCNVYRENDRVTRWIAENWRTPNARDPDVWFAMLVARHVNLPDTLEELGYPVPWDGTRFTRLMASRKRRGLLSYNGAYMIRANSGVPNQAKAVYLRRRVFDPMWKRREELRPRRGDTLEAIHGRLQASFGLGSFMAAQVVADVKYVYPGSRAEDWWSFAASGPGSKRGLNRLLGRAVYEPWREEEWREQVAVLRVCLLPLLSENGLPSLHAQDVQNCLCEFDKYERVRLGEGRPKAVYNVEAGV